MQALLIITKQTGNPGKKQEQELRNRKHFNNDHHPKTEAQRFKYTDKQAKQGNKGAW